MYVRILNAFSVALLLVMFGMLAARYSDLPSEVPMHLNTGRTDHGTGPRSVVWIIPVVALNLFLVLSAFSTLKVSFNPGADEPETRQSFRLVLAIVKSAALLGLTYLSAKQTMVL